MSLPSPAVILRLVLVALLGATAVVVPVGSADAAVTTALLEDFEDADVGYSTSVPEFSDGEADFFTRTPVAARPVSGAATAVTGAQGSGWFHGMDLDGEDATLPITMTFEDVEVTGLSDLRVELLAAEDDSSDGDQDWDTSDYVHVSAAVDGGEAEELLWFESVSDGDAFNAVPALDTDFDGDGDGAELTDTFATFGADIAATGATLDLTVEWNLDAGDEDLALDAVRILGDDGTPGDGGGDDCSPLLVEDFGDDPTSYTASTPEFSDGSGDFFTRTDGSNIGSFYEVSGAEGPWFAAMDLDAEEAAATQSLTFADVNVSCFDDPAVELAVAEDDDGSNEDWDADTGFVVEVDDGTTSTTALAFEATGGTNSEPAEDTDGDGIGDGQALTPAFATFEGSFPAASGVAVTLQFRDLDAGDEDVSIDTLRIVEASGDDGGGNGDGDPELVLVSEVQGTGDASPLVGQDVIVEGVVTGDFQDEAAEGLGGFTVQEEDADQDGDPATSEGVFVFTGGDPADVAPGDPVRVTGTVAEFFDSTQITASEVITREVTGSATPLAYDLEAEDRDDEAVEWQLIGVGDLYAADVFNYLEFGEVLTNPFPRFSPTEVAEPGAAANQVNDRNDSTALVVDDGRSTSNSTDLPFLVRDGDQELDGDPAAGERPVRWGDVLPDATGVLGFSFGAYKLQLVGDHDPLETGATFQPTNPRPTAAPSFEGADLRLASFNTFNLWTTDGGQNRGARSQEQYDVQLAKLTEAVVALDADVLSLQELQTDPVGDGGTVFDAAADGTPKASAEALVDSVNASLGEQRYAHLDTGPIRSDAIMVGLVYDQDTVAPAGEFALVDNDVDPDYDDSRNRSSLVQRFEDLGTGEEFSVAAVHLKSKGDSGLATLCPDPADEDPRDCDQGDQQGFWNQTRTDGARILTENAAELSGDDDVFLLGDFNAYTMEDPIDAITDAGYSDLGELADEEISYTFFGEGGDLDHGFASPSAAEAVVDAEIYDINGPESANQTYFEDGFGGLLPIRDRWRSSDHSPLVVGVRFEPAGPPPSDALAAEYDRVNDQFVVVTGTDDGLRLFAGQQGDLRELPTGTLADAFTSAQFVDIAIGDAGPRRNQGAVAIGNVDGRARSVRGVLTRDGGVGFRGDSSRIGNLTEALAAEYDAENDRFHVVGVGPSGELDVWYGNHRRWRKLREYRDPDQLFGADEFSDIALGDDHLIDDFGIAVGTVDGQCTSLGAWEIGRTPWFGFDSLLFGGWPWFDVGPQQVGDLTACLAAEYDADNDNFYVIGTDASGELDVWYGEHGSWRQLPEGQEPSYTAEQFTDIALGDDHPRDEFGVAIGTVDGRATSIGASEQRRRASFDDDAPLPIG